MEWRDERLCVSCSELDLATIFDPNRFDSLPRVDNDFLGQQQDLDLDGLAARPGKTAPEWIRGVGHWSTPNAWSGTRPGCPFCCLLIDIYETWHHTDNRRALLPARLFAVPSHVLDDLDGLDCLTYVRDAETDTGELAGAHTATCLLVLDRVSLLHFFRTGPEQWKSALWKARRVLSKPFAISISSRAGPERSGSVMPANARLVQDSSINYGLVRQWLAACVAQHGQKCAPPSKPHVPGFKLIHCQTRRIICVLPGQKYDYVALSYVWGKEEAPQPCHSSLLPEKLPLVILDAMTFVSRLGLEYLWVDRYCIAQEDPTHRMSQINKMDQIYGDAFVTVFACAGDDPNYGLPGVSSRQRGGFQLSANVGEVTLVANLGRHGTESRISKSTWGSRAWTFQEDVLSRRRLYVTDLQTSFVCAEMTCFEHLATPLPLSSRTEDYKPPSWNPIQIPHGIWRMINQYSERQLTYQSDRIVAVSGVLNEWSRLHPGCFHYWGVPVVGAASYWRTHPYLSNGDLTNRDRPISSGAMLTKAFLYGLCVRRRFSTSHIDARNRHFPSWSWAGQGTHLSFTYDLDFGLATPMARFDAQVWVENPDGTTVGWEQFVTEGGCRLPLSDWTPYLHIECWEFKVGPFHQRKLALSNGELAFCILAAGDYKEASPKRVWTFEPDSFHSASSTLFTSEFQAISFGPLDTATFALVLDTVHGVLERIGRLDFFPYSVADDGTQQIAPCAESEPDVRPQSCRRRIRLG
jgi:hypothetical protein